MKANSFGLSMAEPALLVPDRVRHAKAAEIMHQPSPADQLPGLAAQPEDARGFPSKVQDS
jgi:hypothetical protein